MGTFGVGSEDDIVVMLDDLLNNFEVNQAEARICQILSNLDRLFGLLREPKIREAHRYLQCADEYLLQGKRSEALSECGKARALWPAKAE